MTRILMSTALCLLLSAPTSALPISVPGGGSWMDAPAPNQDGTPGAIFAGPIAGPFSQQYLLDIEDLPLARSDTDYNDMLVSFELRAVSEPAALLLLGTGLIVVASRLRRRA